MFDPQQQLKMPVVVVGAAPLADGPVNEAELDVKADVARAHAGEFRELRPRKAGFRCGHL